MKRRIFTWVLAFVLIFALLPGTAAASDDAVAAAAAQLRAQLEQRIEDVEITYDGVTDNSISLAVLEEAYAHTGVPTQGDYLRHCSDWYSRGAGGTTLTYIFEYTISAEQEAELTAYLDAVMESFGFTDATDDYTRIKTIYDFVCGNVLYLGKYGGGVSAYDVLMDGGADDGISALLYRLLLEAGIDNRVVRDDASYLNYCWNIVELDGVYYHLDAAQDAGSLNYEGFLLGDGSIGYTRGAEYSSEEFYAAYPMAAADYECDRVFAGNYPAFARNTYGQYDSHSKRYGVPVKAALYEEDGKYIRVEALADGISVETYDLDFVFQSRKNIEMGLPVYGGVHIGEDYNFVVTGQTNDDESDEVEVFRVARYTKDWEYVDHTSMYGANTTVPFRAGSLRCAESNGILYVRTCHEMYTSSDGLNHQANVALAIRISDMTLLDSLTEVVYSGWGYVSHSFNQFTIVDGSTLLSVDHGDAYPRAVVMFRHGTQAGSETFSRSFAELEVLPISTGSDHYNYTGVQVGAFQASGSHYLVAGSSADQSVDGTELGTAQQNIFVTATDKTNFTADGTTVRWFTDYTDTAINHIHLVKLSDSSFCLLWDANDTTHYVFLDGTGAAVSEVYTTDAPLSACVPIVSGDYIVWYAADGGQIRFCRMDLNDPGSVMTYHNHKYYRTVTEPTCTAGGFTGYTCLICGEGYATDTTDALGHSDVSVVTAPTCEEQGFTTHTCSRCGEIRVDTYVPALGHSDASVVTAPTCEDQGFTTHTCSRCGETRVDTYVPALGHDYVSAVTVPACEKQGYTTHTCSRCGDSYTDSYTAATGHSYGPWYITVEAACEKNGQERRDCTVCGKSETAVVDAVGHDYLDGVCVRCGVKEKNLEAPQVTGSNVASSGKVKLTWNAVENAAQYRVYRATSKTGTYKLLKTTIGTTFTNTSAAAGTTYYYCVVALDADGNESEQSNIVTRTCDLPRPVVSISNVASSGKVKLTWEAVDGAVKYRVYRATSKSGEYTLMKTTTGTSYTNTSAKAGTTYYYKVVAVAEKSAANSAYSSYKSRTCDLPRPVVSIALKNGKPRLTWDAVDGAVGYKIYRATSKSGEYKLMKTTTGTSYTNTTAVSGTTYYYKVIAVHSRSAANSAYSLVDSIKAK